ncbi:MAG: hypothetical protein EAX81_01080 [Candidatus Thorarchaeota archaeon]|nr:hypothetical protein [Candidatus Thorarchaeota archaeon]
MSRIAVVTIAVLGPVYFVLLVALMPFQLTPFDDVLFNRIFHYVVVPVVFSAPWLGIIYNNRYRLANTFHLMNETTDAVPLRWRVFYGTNAAFVVVFFVLPLVTAPLAIVGGLVIAGHVFYRIGVGKLGGGKPAAFLGALVAIALCILPIIVMIEFIPNYLQVWETILSAWSTLWVDIVYAVSQCLVNALNFGAPIYFIYFAAGEYDRGLYGRLYTRTPSGWIRFGEAVIFAVFLYLYLPVVVTPFGFSLFLGLDQIFTQYINWISLGIMGIMILVKFGLGVSDNSTLGGPSNILIVGAFLIVEIVNKTNLVLKTIIIWLAFLIFSGVSLVNYVRASPREMY